MRHITLSMFDFDAHFVPDSCWENFVFHHRNGTRQMNKRSGSHQRVFRVIAIVNRSRQSPNECFQRIAPGAGNRGAYRPDRLMVAG